MKIRIKKNNKTRNKIDSISNLEYVINIDIRLDREGLIFNSIGDEYEEKRQLENIRILDRADRGRGVSLRLDHQGGHGGL